MGNIKTYYCFRWFPFFQYVAVKALIALCCSIAVSIVLFEVKKKNLPHFNISGIAIALSLPSFKGQSVRHGISFVVPDMNTSTRMCFYSG